MGFSPTKIKMKKEFINLPSFDFLCLWISYVIYNIYFLLEEFGGFLGLWISYAICNIYFLLEDFVVCEGRCTHVHVKSSGQLQSPSHLVLFVNTDPLTRVTAGPGAHQFG